MDILYSRLSSEQVAEAIRSIVGGMEVPYFTTKEPEILVTKWQKLMSIGLAHQYGAWADDKWVGLMLGMISEDMLSSTKQALECAWQVLPEYRHTGAAQVLMQMFEEDAKRAGCFRVVFGAATSFKYEPMVRLYRKLGYKPISLAMAKDL